MPFRPFTVGVEEGLGVISLDDVLLPFGEILIGLEFPLIGSLWGFSIIVEFDLSGALLLNSLSNSASPLPTSLPGRIGALFPVGVFPSEN